MRGARRFYVSRPPVRPPLFHDREGFCTAIRTKPFAIMETRFAPRQPPHTLGNAEDRWMPSLAMAEGSGPGSQDPAGHPAQVNVSCTGSPATGLGRCRPVRLAPGRFSCLRLLRDDCVTTQKNDAKREEAHG
jgi:hypothetical protein